MKTPPSFRLSKLVTAVAGIAVVLILPVTAGASCTLPDSIVFGKTGEQLKFEADRERAREAKLDTINFLTRLRWLFGPVFPGLTAGEVKVHLYDTEKSGFLTKYDDIESTRIVKFFLACEDDGEYKAIPGTISKFPDGSPQGNDGSPEDWKGYIGMTYRPGDTEADVTLTGDLFAFLHQKAG